VKIEINKVVIVHWGQLNISPKKGETR
jgi:hypothetical protein